MVKKKAYRRKAKAKESIPMQQKIFIFLLDILAVPIFMRNVIAGTIFLMCVFTVYHYMIGFRSSIEFLKYLVAGFMISFSIASLISLLIH